MSELTTGLFAARRDRWVSLLEADPELGRDVDAVSAPAAARAAQVRVIPLEPGAWSPEPDAPASGALGVIVLEGVLCRTVMFGDVGSDELVGRGDVFYPWAGAIDSTVLEASVSWCVVEPAEVAVLDRHLMLAIAPWPELTAQIVYRYGARSRLQGALAATAHVKRVDIRLLALFWYLAERWGRVTPEGIVIPVRLTHTRLARLVGAQRPSVTTVLSRMARDGTLKRWPAGGFVLGAESIAVLEELGKQSQHGAVPPPGSDDG